MVTEIHFGISATSNARYPVSSTSHAASSQIVFREFFQGICGKKSPPLPVPSETTRTIFLMYPCPTPFTQLFLLIIENAYFPNIFIPDKVHPYCFLTCKKGTPSYVEILIQAVSEPRMQGNSNEYSECYLYVFRGR